MSNLGVNFERLHAAVDWSIRQLETPRKNRVDAIRQYVGSHYADGGADKRVPTNFLELAVTIYTRQLAARAPRAIERAAVLPRWILENAFLIVCQQYFGTPTKRGTKELLGKAFELVETDTKAAMQAFGIVIGLDKELVRVAGDLWWDSCEWHDDAEAISGARAYLGLVP